MHTLELSSRHLALLREILAEYHDQLLMEIANTDARAFRDELRHRETLVRELFDLAGAAAGSTPAAPGAHTIPT